jgi:hypothetical protein
MKRRVGSNKTQLTKCLKQSNEKSMEWFLQNEVIVQASQLLYPD